MSPAGELWEGLSPEERKQVARLCPERRFSKGSTIFAPGGAPDALYVLTSGLVTLSCVLSRHLAEIALDRGRAGHKWSAERLALTLSKLATAHGVKEKAGTAITLPLTHQILADMIGGQSRDRHPSPLTGSWLAGIVVLALLAAVTVYGWWSDELSHRKAERSALRKAA